MLTDKKWRKRMKPKINLLVRQSGIETRSTASKSTALDAEANLPEQLLDTNCNFRVYKGIKKFIVL